MLPDPNYVSAAQARRLAVQQITYPAIPVFHRYDTDDGDATHPIKVKYVIPSAFSLATVGRASLSWSNDNFRSTTQLNPSTVSTDATGESGHSHSHAHILTWAGGSAGAGVSEIGNTLAVNGGPITDTTACGTNAAGSSGHSHSHSHTLTGGGSQIVTDSTTLTTVTNLSIDGTDLTSKLGGPWPTNDVFELDITSVFPTNTGVWHTILFTLGGLGRLWSELTVYYQ